jgi:putative FmdB family regulatory protein
VPTYSYRCANCGHEFDQYQAFTDDTLTVCPSCGEPQLRKVFNSIGVSFTGSGFYRNDSRADASGSKSSGALNATTDSSSTSASSDSAAKSEPKAQKPAESKAATPAAAPSKPAPTT